MLATTERKHCSLSLSLFSTFSSFLLCLRTFTSFLLHFPSVRRVIIRCADKLPPSRQFHPHPHLSAALSNTRPLADFSARFPAGGENRPRKNSAKTKSNDGNSPSKRKKKKEETKEKNSNSIDLLANRFSSAYFLRAILFLLLRFSVDFGEFTCLGGDSNARDCTEWKCKKLSRDERLNSFFLFFFFF